MRIPLLVWLLTASPVCAQCPPVTAESLRCADLAELDRVFAAGTMVTPIGSAPGRVLYVARGRSPRLSAALASSTWKGKQFTCKGVFNQWLGVRTYAAPLTIEASWFDGQPCFVIDYPPNRLVFGNTRDEIRCVAPGVYLGRYYDREPCRALHGYFVLVLE